MLSRGIQDESEEPTPTQIISAASFLFSTGLAGISLWSSSFLQLRAPSAGLQTWTDTAGQGVVAPPLAGPWSWLSL